MISPPDKILVYTAMYVGPIRPSVTGPLASIAVVVIVVLITVSLRASFTFG